MTDSITLLSANEAAARCEVHITTFLRWVDNGDAPKPEFRAKQAYLWRVQTIEKFVEGREG